MITDDLKDAVWLTHPGGTASIGGVAYTSATMAQVSGDELTMQVAGNADPGPENYPCQMWYTKRPIYSQTGCTLEAKFRLSSTALAAMNAIEVDGMYAMLCADGQTRTFNGSAQWIPGIGWMIWSAAGKWVATGYNPPYKPGKKNRVRFVHAWDLTANTMSVVSIDGFQVSSALQNVPAKVMGWAAGFVNVQVQPSSKPAGLPWAVWVKVKLVWGTA
jgi:hypothetical protein